MEDLVAANLKKRVEEADLTFAVDNDNGDAGTSAETEVTGAVPLTSACSTCQREKV